MRNQLLATVALTVLLGACAADPGSPEARMEAAQEAKVAQIEARQDMVDSIPDWYITPPVSDLAVFSVGSGKSDSLPMAMTKATLTAKRMLADRIAGELTEKIREFATEMGTTQNPVTVDELERATANVIQKTAVSGYRMSKKEVQATYDGYIQVYVLLEYGDEEVNKVLKRNLQKERNKTINKRKQELFKELEKQLDRSA